MTTQKGWTPSVRSSKFVPPSRTDVNFLAKWGVMTGASSGWNKAFAMFRTTSSMASRSCLPLAAAISDHTSGRSASEATSQRCINFVVRCILKYSPTDLGAEAAVRAAAAAAWASR